MVTNVTVFLYQNSKSDNFNRIKKITGQDNDEKLENQNAYFDGLNKIKVDGTFNKFGEKILLNGSLNYFLNCGYGRFEYYGKYYYFSVTDFEVCNDSKTYMIYRFDYYETARFQYGLKFGIGLVKRCKESYNIVRGKPISDLGLGQKVLNRDKTYNNIYGVLMYVYHSDASRNHGELCLIRKTPTYEITFYGSILYGYYAKHLLDAGVISTFSDIKGCWIIPNGFFNDDPTENGFELVQYVTNTIYHYDSLSRYPLHGIMNGFDLSHKLTLKRDDTEYSIVKDSRNIPIWEFPRGFSGTVNVIPEWTLNISPTSASFKIYLNGFPMGNEYVNDYFFIYNCDTLPVFNDAYQEYAYRQRDADIRNRQIQNEQQTLNALMNVGTSAISGGIAGGSVGMTGIGAVGGAVSGTVSAIGSYYINDYYGNQIQDVTDRTYKRAEDQLILQGDGLSLFAERGEWGFCRVSYSGDWGASLVTGEISAIGYDCNVKVDDTLSNDLMDYINSTNVKGYLMGDFEILGNFPSVWKKQIQDRFKQGVTFEI